MCREAALAAVRTYHERMSEYAEQRDLDVWYAFVSVDRLTPRLTQVGVVTKRRTQKFVAKAKTRDHLQAFSKMVQLVDGQARFVSDPPLLVPVEELLPDAPAHLLEDLVRDALKSYTRTLSTERRHLLSGYRFSQLARKVVGVGSVGTRAWIALMLGRDGDDPLIQQFIHAEFHLSKN